MKVGDRVIVNTRFTRIVSGTILSKEKNRLIVEVDETPEFQHLKIYEHQARKIDDDIVIDCVYFPQFSYTINGSIVDEDAVLNLWDTLS